jgi:acetylornithine/succinyldiaminopimelate/putrescine aminotransferase
VGLLLGLELEAGLSATHVRDALLERGVLVGTSNDPRVLRLSPPLTFEPALAERLSAAFDRLPLEVSR